MRKSYHEQRKVRCVVVATRSILNHPVAGCPFCHPNGKLAVIAHYPASVPESEASAYLVLALNAPNGDDHLIIPAVHAVGEDELPDDFMAACKYLRQFIPWIGGYAYHTGENYGLDAGLTVDHLHRWYSKVPKGLYVPGIATLTQQEVRCQNVTGQTVADFLRGNSDYGLLYNAT